VNRSGVGGPAGSVYVSEGASNQRISQFTADGDFVRTWGYDVVDAVNHPGAANDNGTGFEICDVTNGNTANQCKAGVAGGAAGQLGNPLGIAIDQSNGYLFVPSTANRRVDVFSGSGQFAGAFGFDVLPGDPNPSGPDFCTTATGCQAAAAGANAGRFGAFAAGSTPAVDPDVPGRVYVPDPGNLRVAQYSTTVTGGVLTVAAFDKAFGWDVIPGGATGLESCTATCQAGTSGNGSGQFTTGGSPSAVAVDSTDAIYATSGPLTAGTCSVATPCRVLKFAPDATSATDFGPATGPGQLTFTSGAANSVAAVNVTVDPSNGHVFVMRRETSTTYRILEYDSAGSYIETHPAGSALPATAVTLATGLAVGISGRVYANSGAANFGRVFILGPVDPPGVTIEPVTDVGATTATFNAAVDIPPPGSPTFITRYHFEYTSNGVDWISVPAQDVAVGDGGAGTHSVSESVTGLAPGVLYSVRLVATTGPTATSTTTSFTTDSTGPRVALSFVDEVTQTEARLGAHIDPEGLPTTYRFEWGATDSYGNEVPAFERQVGDGSQSVIVHEPIEGLQPQSSYHYRVVATNYCHPTDANDTTPSTVSCVTEGPDQTFETLNSCGLTDGRCYEMVSPPDKGPVGIGGHRAVLGFEMQFQAAHLAPSIAYTMGYGLPDSAGGGELLYRADRSDSGWSSTEISMPAPGVSNTSSYSDPSFTRSLSSDLSCGIYASDQPLVEGGPTAVLDAGNSILYHRDADGEYTPIPNVDPVNPAVDQDVFSDVVGMSDGPDDGCDRVVFYSLFHYPGVPGAGVWRLYLWEDGVLSNVGEVPGPGGEAVPVQASPGAPNRIDSIAIGPSRNFWNAVSDDLSRIFFTAVRLTSPQPAEVGRLAVFVRKDGNSTGVDVSQSQTDIPNDGPSRYETASPDGKYVFFTAKQGLADNDDSAGPASCSAGEAGHRNGPGCDLYRYSVDGGTLTDLTVPGDDSNAGGAGVAGAIGTSDDGSRVYFAARGQLVPGKGPSEAQNLADNSYSIYLSETSEDFPNGKLKFVGTIVHNIDSDTENVLLVTSTRAVGPPLRSRVTPDGRHLLFESRASLTGIDSNGRSQAYLYSADTDTTVCVSCRRDGKPPVGEADPSVPPIPVESRPIPLTSNGDASNPLSPPRSLTDDGRRVFFSMYDRLAVGAIEGRSNLYQWEDGQISLIGTSSAPGYSIRNTDLAFGGASANGDDVYFTTVDKYSWQDIDAKPDVYDARVGGGFAAPPTPEAPCDPLVAAGCHGAGGSETGAVVDTGQPGEGDLMSAPRAALSVRGLSKAQRARLIAGRRVGVAVRVSRPGAVSLRGTATIGGFRVTVLSASRNGTAAGTVRIPVALSRAARRHIARTGGLRVTLVARLAGGRKDVTSRIAFSKAMRPKPKARNRGSSQARAATTDWRPGQ